MKDRHEWTDDDGLLWRVEAGNGLPTLKEHIEEGVFEEDSFQNFVVNAEILRLAAEVERLRAEREWRPVSETPECPRWAIVKLVRSDGWVSYELIDAFVSWSDFDETVAGGSLAWEAVGWRYLLPEPPDEVNL